MDPLDSITIIKACEVIEAQLHALDEMSSDHPWLQLMLPSRTAAGVIRRIAERPLKKEAQS